MADDVHFGDEESTDDEDLPSEDEPDDDDIPCLPDKTPKLSESRLLAASDRRDSIGADGDGERARLGADRAGLYSGEEAPPDEEAAARRGQKRQRMPLAYSDDEWRTILSDAVDLISHTRDVFCRDKGPDHFEVCDGMRAIAFLWSIPIRVLQCVENYDSR